MEQFSRNRHCAIVDASSKSLIFRFRKLGKSERYLDWFTNISVMEVAGIYIHRFCKKSIYSFDNTRFTNSVLSNQHGMLIK